MVGSCEPKAESAAFTGISNTCPGVRDTARWREIYRISMPVPPPLHEVLAGKQVLPLRCRRRSGAAGSCAG